MKAPLVNKLGGLLERHEELGALLSDAEVISDQEQFRNYSREYAEIEPVVRCHGRRRCARSLTAVSDDALGRQTDKVNRQFSATRPNQLCMADTLLVRPAFGGFQDDATEA